MPRLRDLLAGRVHAKRMKSFLRYVETSRARMDFQQLDESSGDVKYQKALSRVNSVVPLPQDLVWSLQQPHAESGPCDTCILWVQLVRKTHACPLQSGLVCHKTCTASSSRKASL